MFDTIKAFFKLLFATDYQTAPRQCQYCGACLPEKQCTCPKCGEENENHSREVSAHQWGTGEPELAVKGDGHVFMHFFTLPGYIGYIGQVFLHAVLPYQLSFSDAL
jgi:hypothetical protein